MRGEADNIRGKAAGAAMALFAGATACGVEALRTHLWLTSLGPICGLGRPGLFFIQCPACPIGLALLAASGMCAVVALRAPTPAARRA
jgi:hypothetical protein